MLSKTVRVFVKGWTKSDVIHACELLTSVKSVTLMRQGIVGREFTHAADKLLSTETLMHVTSRRLDGIEVLSVLGPEDAGLLTRTWRGVQKGLRPAIFLFWRKRHPPSFVLRWVGMELVANDGVIIDIVRRLELFGVSSVLAYLMSCAVDDIVFPVSYKNKKSLSRFPLKGEVLVTYVQKLKEETDDEEDIHKLLA